MLSITHYQRNANQNHSEVSCMLVRIAAIQKSTNNKCWRGCREKGTLLTLLVGMQTSTATMQNIVEIPLKTGNRTAI